MSVSTAAVPGVWLRSARWDISWLVLSALIIPIPPLLHALGMSPEGVAILVMLLIGGPHVFVTFTRSGFDPAFLRSHPTFAKMSLLVPVATAFLALNFTPFFLTFFFAWASLHVIHQIVYITDGYSNRQRAHPSGWERFVEYGLLFATPYPLSLVRLVNGTFALDGTVLYLPEFLKADWFIAVGGVVFAFFLIAYIVNTVRRARTRQLHAGKTALISMTVAGTFFTPLLPNLDVAFQGVNSWHCVQYLALMWLANRTRIERGEMEGRFSRRLSGPGARGVAAYYGTAVAFTLGLLLFITGINRVFGVSWLLAYYMFGKGVLLMHYYFDTFLFTQKDEITLPRPVPARI